MNIFVITGTINRKVTIKKSKNGKEYAVVDLLIDPRFKDSNKVEEGRVVVFYEKAKEVEKEFVVGSRVQLEGFLRFKNFTPGLILLNYFVDPYKNNDYNKSYEKENYKDDISPFEDDF